MELIKDIDTAIKLTDDLIDFNGKELRQILIRNQGVIISPQAQREYSQKLELITTLRKYKDYISLNRGYIIENIY